MKDPLASVFTAGAPLRPSFALRNSFERHGGLQRFWIAPQFYQERLERVEDSLPAHDAVMEERVGISEKALANLPRLPCFGRNIHRHANHDVRADDIAARRAAPVADGIALAAIV